MAKKTDLEKAVAALDAQDAEIERLLGIQATDEELDREQEKRNTLGAKVDELRGRAAQVEKLRIEQHKREQERERQARKQAAEDAAQTWLASDENIVTSARGFGVVVDIAIGRATGGPQLGFCREGMRRAVEAFGQYQSRHVTNLRTQAMGSTSPYETNRDREWLVRNLADQLRGVAQIGLLTITVDGNPVKVSAKGLVEE